ncbi:P-type DNA transfer protein VirB5 [Moraxella lacunata]|uniref:P-type DNA transfer protein VirB5 n=1 Tax=Moraxella lacunata TaxID=477 RepID=A0A378UC09_MORLA|nr:type IV secretion system protein [Moraxella lacunata]STZ74924.1 P-type DNA transfer protein VirB5 [Moraxella lacunata]
MRKVNFSKKALAVIASLALLVTTVPAQSGVPVIDATAIAQAVAQVENQIRQIENMRAQLKAMTDNGNYAELLDNPAIRQQLNKYLPKGYTDVFEAARRGDLSALNKVVDAMKKQDQQTRTNQSGAALASAQVVQARAVLGVAANNLNAREVQLESLVRQLNATQNPAQKQDLIGAITAHHAAVQTDLGKIQIQMQMAEQYRRQYEQYANQESMAKLQEQRRANFKKKHPNSLR